jgi:hypothetical protein
MDDSQNLINKAPTAALNLQPALKTPPCGAALKPSVHCGYSHGDGQHRGRVQLSVLGLMMMLVLAPWVCTAQQEEATQVWVEQSEFVASSSQVLCPSTPSWEDGVTELKVPGPSTTDDDHMKEDPLKTCGWVAVSTHSAIRTAVGPKQVTWVHFELA